MLLYIINITNEVCCCEDICVLHARVVHVGPYMYYVNLMYSSTVGHQGWKCSRPFDWMTPGDLQGMSGRM